MKTLIAYYSKSGNTRKIAEVLKAKLNADIDEIKDIKKKSFIGVMLACRNAMKGRPSKIVFSKNPAEYDLVVLGGPVWAWNLMPPLRGYLEENKNKIKKLGFFLTYGGNIGKNFEQVAEIKKPIATMKIVDKEVKARNYGKEVEGFVGKLT